MFTPIQKSLVRLLILFLAGVGSFCSPIEVLATEKLDSGSPPEADFLPAAEWVDAAFYDHRKKVSYMFQGDRYYRLSGIKADSGYPKRLPGGWKGLPTSFRSGIDAAVYDPQVNKIFLFRGTQVVRVSGSQVDRGYPKSIREEFRGVPGSFSSNIDAAIYYNNKVYLFKEGKYTRFSINAAGRRNLQVARKYNMDDGYPKGLPGGWKGLQGPFRSRIDAAIFYKGNGKNYFFKGRQYTRLSGTKLDSGYPTNMPGGWKGMRSSQKQKAPAASPPTAAPSSSPPSTPPPAATPTPPVAPPASSAPASQTWVDAACYHHERKVSYFFQGNTYYRLKGTQVDGKPRRLPGGWSGLPSSFHSGVDAAVYDPQVDRLFLFKGSQVVRITGTKVDRGYPKSINEDWRGLPGTFYQGIDAAIYRNGKVYFFRGDQYARMSINAVRSGNVNIPRKYNTDGGYPKKLPGGWNISAPFNRQLDAAIAFAPNGKNYFFKGNRYLRLTDVKADRGYPKDLPGGWKGLKVGQEIADQTIAFPIKIWQYPGAQDSRVRISKEELVSEITQITDNAALADEVVSYISAGSGGALTASGIAVTVAENFDDIAEIFEKANLGETVTGIVGIVTGAALGAMDIVDKVRAENGTTLLLVNTVQNSQLKITEAVALPDRRIQNNTFRGSLLNAANNNSVAVDKATMASVETNADHFGAIALDLSPKRGIEGRLQLAFNHGGRTYSFYIDVENFLGVRESLYSVGGKGWKAKTLRADRKTSATVRKEILHSSGRFKLVLKLEHKTDEDGKTDRKKDVFSLVISENESGADPAETTDATSPGAAVSESPIWIDAALYHHSRGKSYLFRGNQYFRLTGNKVDKGYPRAMPGGWKGLPSRFYSDIDAAVYDPEGDKLFLFKGSEVVRLTGIEVDRGYPKYISEDWEGLPGSFKAGIEAALYRKGKMYLFKGNRYARLTRRRVQDKYRLDDNYPTELPGGWGLPAGLRSDINAALGLSGKNYFFKKSNYARLSDTRLDAGHPTSLPGGWQGLKLIQNEKATLTLNLWEYPGIRETRIETTEGQFLASLTESTGDPDLAKKITKTVLSASGSAATVVGTAIAASAGSGPFPVVSGVIGTAVGLMVGTMAVINKVRAENTSTIVLMNTEPGTTLEIANVLANPDTRIKQRGFLGQIITESGKQADVFKTIGARAVTTETETGAILLVLIPDGGLSKISGRIVLKMTNRNNQVSEFILDIKDRVAAGQPSTYTLTGPNGTSKTLESTRRDDKEEARLSYAGGRSGVWLKLQHEEKRTERNDQRKDVLTVTFHPGEPER